MNTLAAFSASLTANQPAPTLSAPLKSLWYDGKGDWHRAHAEVDHLNDKLLAWVHAYLHRKEGDYSNADYWYRRAGKIRLDIPLAEEWKQLVTQML